MAFDAENIALIVLGLLLLFTGGTLIAKRRAARRDPYPFEFSPPFDDRIKALLPQLNELAAGRYLLCPAVPLSQLLRPRAGLSGKARRRQLERLAEHRVDVLLCDEDSLQPAGALLIDGAEDRSGFRARALLAGGIPAVRLPRAPVEAREKLRDLLEEGLGVNLGGTRKPAGNDWLLGAVEAFEDDAASWSLGETAVAIQPAAPVRETGRNREWPPCPVCGSPQTVRRPSRGRHQGKEFLVCSRFPECQHLRPVGRN